MNENGIHFTLSPVNAYGPVITGIILLAMGLLAYLTMPHAMPQVLACGMFGFMCIAVGIIQFGRLNTPFVSIYPNHIVSNSKRIEFHDIKKVDRRGKLQLNETTYQLPLQLLRSGDRLKVLKWLDERLKIDM
jgi:hypothetical protein